MKLELRKSVTMSATRDLLNCWGIFLVLSRVMELVERYKALVHRLGKRKVSAKMLEFG
jgi:hypothetical protein